MTVDVRPQKVSEALAELAKRLYTAEQQASRPADSAGESFGTDPVVNTITIGGIVVGSPASPATNLVLSVGSFMDDIWVDADWDAPADGTAAEYDVELSRKVGITYELVQNHNIGGGTSLRMNALEPQRTYGVRVTAINRIQARSTPLPATGFTDITTGIDATIPGQVTGLITTSMLRGFQLRWNEVTDRDVIHGAGQYQVQWSLTTGAAFGDSILGDSFTTANIISIPINSYSGLTFYFRVRAVDTSGNSGPWSAEASSTMSQAVANDIATAAITTAKLSNLAVDNTKLAALAVDAAKLADSAVTSVKIANLAVGTAAIAALAVGSAQIADAAIVTAKIGNLQVVTAKIADLAVDNAKINDLDAVKITAGVINADRIAANSLDVNKLTTSTLTSKTITIGAGGIIKIGTPPTTGVILNDQGLRLYSGGVVKVALDVAGTASFEGNISASTITSSTLTSATINSGTITGTTIRTAASGQRVALEAGVVDAIQFYTGNASESFPGRIAVAISGSALTTELRSPRSSGNDFSLSLLNSVTGGNGSQAFWGIFSGSGVQRAHLALVSDNNSDVPRVISEGIDELYINFSYSGTNALAKLRGSGNYGFLYLWGGGQVVTLNANNGLGAGVHVMNSTNATFEPVQASAFTVSSAQDVKNTIRDSAPMLAQLEKVRVTQFKRNRPAKIASPSRPSDRFPVTEVPEPPHITRAYEIDEVGFIAEELLQVIPDAVVMGENGPTGVNLAHIVGVLVKSVQELATEVKEIKAK